MKGTNLEAPLSSRSLQLAREYLELTKPRVVALIVFTALVGMFLAVPGWPPLDKLLLGTLGISLASASAAAINHLIDRQVDAMMARTRARPLPTGQLTVPQATVFAVVLGALAMLVLALGVNRLTAVLTFVSLIGYAVIYTVWLKRATPQNIVIGGAAGAFPPMIGWVCATGSLSVEAVLMFALIFMWTPPHFWALALFMKEDYHTAGVPMLTVTHGRRATRAHVLGYALLLVPVSLWSALSGIGGPFTLAVAVVLNAMFLAGAWRIWRRDENSAIADRYAVEKRVFRFSLSYLFLHFGAFLAEAALTPFGLGGW